MMNFNGSWWGFGPVVMILWWVVLIVGLIALVRWLVDKEGNKRNENTALDILKERYAKGEISQKEFDEKKQDLGL